MPRITVVTPSIRPEGLAPTQRALEAQSFTDFEWLVEIGLPKKNGHDLNASYNRMIRRAKGKLVVSLQDYITPGPEGLEMFWKEYEKNPFAYITGPMIKIGKNSELKSDWRANCPKDSLFKIEPRDWEADWASIPRQALLDIGGYDESYDIGWSWDNCNVGERAALAGYQPYCMGANISLGIDHDELMEHPFRGKLENQELHALKMKEIQDGKGFKLSYL